MTGNTSTMSNVIPHQANTQTTKAEHYPQRSTRSTPLLFCTINKHRSHMQLDCKGHSIQLWFLSIFQLLNPPAIYKGSVWKNMTRTRPYARCYKHTHAAIERKSEHVSC